MKFKVGDRVKGLGITDGRDIEGMNGTVVYCSDIDDSRQSVSVDFDEITDGHDCGGKARAGHGWNVSNYNIKLLIRSERLKVGDRVISIASFGCCDLLAGKTGTVVYTFGARIGVDFDEAFDLGHNCDGRARPGHGRYGKERELKLLEELPDQSYEVPDEQPIEITLNLPPSFAYVARDMDGQLFAYIDKPKRDVGGTQWYGVNFKKIDDDLFTEVKWTDEPCDISKIKRR